MTTFTPDQDDGRAAGDQRAHAAAWAAYRESLRDLTGRAYEEAEHRPGIASSASCASSRPSRAEPVAPPRRPSS